MDLSIIVLNYQGDPLVYGCLDSIFNSSFKNYELVFVDNNSSDGSYEKSLAIIGNRKDVIIIRNNENLGFTRGFDIGIRNSHGKYILLLNNDAAVYPNALAELIKFMNQNPSVGLAEGRIENISDGIHSFSDPTISLFFGILSEAGEHMNDPKSLATIDRIFSPVGVWPIIRREVYDRIGGYDNDYVHFEEIRDLAARVWIFGSEVGYVYGAVTQHIGRLTEVRKNYGGKLAFELYFHAAKNQIMFFLKNYSPSSIIKFYLPYLLIKSGDLFYTLIILGRRAFITKICAYVWILRNMSSIMIKRRFIAKNRIVKDKYIMEYLLKPDRNVLRTLIKMREKYDQKTYEWIAPSSKS